MSDSNSEPMQFNAFTGGGGTPFGGLRDPTGVSVTLSGFTYGAEAGWGWLQRAAETHKEALDDYLRLLRAAGGDVTDPRVKAAANELHASVHSLPIGHAAYAGVGFPSPDRTESRASSSRDEEPEVARRDADRLHPFLDTALRGSRMQRHDLAQQPELPIEVELILAKDPELIVRLALVDNGTRSRSTLLLLERDETDDGVRSSLVSQRFASAELKLPLPIADLYWESLHGVADLLGLDSTLRARLQEARDQVDYGGEDGPTVQDVLLAAGWTPPAG